MNAPNDVTVADEISIERVFDAPRTLVFENWVEADHVGAWFAPTSFEVISSEVDARPGGRWRVAYRSSAGEMYIEYGEFKEVVVPERLVFTLTQENGDGHVVLRTEVRVTFTESSGKTTMMFRQTGFASSKTRHAVAEGWGACFRKLDDALRSEREIRELFDALWRASTAKDIEASMAPLARDCVAYEHQAPLVHHGADAMRPGCQRGFDQMPEGFRWDVPDLRVVVRGDVAVTWGLNHMHASAPGNPKVDMWSRGTRVFQKLGGRWQMIHQHVSFPFDPATGQARTDLSP